MRLGLSVFDEGVGEVGEGTGVHFQKVQCRYAKRVCHFEVKEKGGGEGGGRRLYSQIKKNSGKEKFLKGQWEARSEG